jgi:Flp pilus assembly protein TadG
VLAIVALSLVVIIAAVGLVLDAGGSWAQRRSQQSASDVAALAAATKEANGGTKAQIIQAAIDSATANGHTTGVTVNIPPTQGPYGPGGMYYSSNDCSAAERYPCVIEVLISKPHQNGFASIIPGQASWQVTARGAAIGGLANSAASGASPIMFNEAAVDPANISGPGNEKTYCNPHPSKCPPNEPSPQDETQFSWTIFCIGGGANCNVDSANVKAIINGGDLRKYPTIEVGMTVGPNNNGGRVSVCKDLMDAYPNGGDIAVAIVDASNPKNAILVAWWIWHFDAANSDCKPPETLAGWFVTDATSTLPLTIDPRQPPAIRGIPIVRLVD